MVRFSVKYNFEQGIGKNKALAYTIYSIKKTVLDKKKEKSVEISLQKNFITFSFTLIL